MAGPSTGADDGDTTTADAGAPPAGGRGGRSAAMAKYYLVKSKDEPKLTPVLVAIVLLLIAQACEGRGADHAPAAPPPAVTRGPP